MNRPMGKGCTPYFRDITVPRGSLRMNEHGKWYYRGKCSSSKWRWNRGWSILGTIYGVYEIETGKLLYIGKTSNTLASREGAHNSAYKFGEESLLHPYVKELGGWEHVRFETLYEPPKEYLNAMEEYVVRMYNPPYNVVPGGTARGRKRQYGSGPRCWGCISRHKSKKRSMYCGSSNTRRRPKYWFQVNDGNDSKYIGRYRTIEEAHAVLMVTYNKALAADPTLAECHGPRSLDYYRNHLCPLNLYYS